MAAATQRTMTTPAVHSIQTIQSKRDGTDLFVQKWASPSAAAATGSNKTELVLLHGYLEHGGRYAEFAEFLCSRGAANVTVFDFRGHGRSGGKPALCRSFDEYLADFETVLETLPKDCKCFVLGHSNGGLTLLYYMLRLQQASSASSATTSDTTTKTSSQSSPSFQLPVQLAGVIVTCPFLAPAADLGWFKVQVSKLLGAVAPALSLPADLDASDLTHDARKIREHRDDPLIHPNITVGWGCQGMKVQRKVIDDLGELDLPLLFVYADGDKVAKPEANRVLADKIVASDKTVVVREGEYHEILNETNRLETFVIIQEWIQKRSADS